MHSRVCGVASTRFRVGGPYLSDIGPAAGSCCDEPPGAEDTDRLAHDREAYAQLLGKDSFAKDAVADVQGEPATTRDWI